MELEYNEIVPIVQVVTTKRDKEDEIKHYLQLLVLAVWEEYKEESHGNTGFDARPM